MWQLSGIPCVHAISCLLHRNVFNFEEHVDQKFRIPMYLQTYADMIHPVPDKTSWPEISDEKIWPPTKQPKPGRPPKSRRRDPTEEPKSKRVSTLRCSVYNVMGHNKRSCKKNPANANKGKKQKRTFVRTMTAPSSAAQFAASSMPSSTHMSILSQTSSSRGQPSH
ncbi:hypothetical protein Pint_13742 [Pistacia integerrima]|uniref:Uncharacterized protein n=1 Tax=Pistacia integerrima TaxID=434235 RepID=A0ACC0Y870_9ROSI|nr:hypothetical protein Pint_13742 [Pistacia integerrima]